MGHGKLLPNYLSQRVLCDMYHIKTDGQVNIQNNVECIKNIFSLSTSDVENYILNETMLLHGNNNI